MAKKARLGDVEHREYGDLGIGAFSKPLGKPAEEAQDPGEEKPAGDASENDKPKRTSSKGRGGAPAASRTEQARQPARRQVKAANPRTAPEDEEPAEASPPPKEKKSYYFPKGWGTKLKELAVVFEKERGETYNPSKVLEEALRKFHPIFREDD